MPPPDRFVDVIHAIARRDEKAASEVRRSPELARASLAVGATRASACPFFLSEIGHYVYAGDTLLHVASAAYATELVRCLLDCGASVAARNRRGAQPLHYASDGNPNRPTWNPRAQARTVTLLIEAGADPNALDKSGVAPLHRAVRTRSTGAVRALLAGGADPRLPNKNGSTPADLLAGTTGRGGSGSDEARREQRAIERLLVSALAVNPRSRR
jgi:ankyrin repeat protein